MVRDLLDVAVEQAERVRVGEHQAGGVVAGLLAQVVEVHAAVGRRAHLHHLEARHRHGGRVGAVRGVRREHLVAALAAVLEVGAREHQARQLAVRPGARLKRHVRQPGHLGQLLLEVPHQLERALRVTRLLQRVEAREAGQRRHLLVDLGVVFHRARPERVEAGVEIEVLLGQVVVVPHDLRLGYLRQGRRLRPNRMGRQQLGDRYVRHVQLRSDKSPPPLLRLLEDRECGLAQTPTPSRTPATTAASRSISRFVRRSVIATSRQSSYSG